MFWHPASVATELMPDTSGLVLIFAAIGALGGALAAVHYSDERQPPTIWGVAKRTIVGFGLGMATGMFGLAKWKLDDAQKYWVGFYALISGFVGPYAVWNFIVDYVINRLRATLLTKTSDSPSKGDPP